MDIIHLQIEESLRVINLILEDQAIQKSIKEAAALCSRSLKKGNKIIFAGNGGSAADAQHLAAELVNRFSFDRPALAAVAITTDTSVITSISNDYEFEKLFARQLEAIGKSGDIFISLSTSGNSANILEGLRVAKKLGLITIGLTGISGGKMKRFCDMIIKVPSDETPRIQEVHILIGHIICSLVENSLFGKQGQSKKKSI
jgi:D-sedoheptulose 7-phosphate isomerase